MSNLKKKRSKTFIEECLKINGDKYDYSLVEYINNKIKINIICKTHGLFRQTPNNHLSKKQDCPKCSHYHFEKKDKEQVIIDFKKIHGEKYDYSKINYKNSKFKVEIVCSKHGSFFQTPNNHLKGQDCPFCLKITTDDFINKSNEIHNFKYNYDITKYSTTRNLVSIICDKHGVFNQKASVHLSGSGCPKCIESKGENSIRIFLEKNSIIYNSQHHFEDCKFKKKLKFDFYIDSAKCCIEFDGEQHHKSIEFFGGELGLLQRKNRDDIKNKYCDERGIKLIRINKIKEIEPKLRWLI